MNRSSSQMIVDRAQLERRAFLSVTAEQQSPRGIREIVLSMAEQLGDQADIVDLIGDDGKDPLPTHTETIYSDSPLRYFILGCVRPSQSGGATIIFDARVAADLVIEQAPELAAVKIEYRSESHNSQAVHELIQVRALKEGERPVLIFREQTPTNQVIGLPSGWTEKTFYSFMASVLANSIAARHLWSMGDVLIVDNYVSLHSRESFSGSRAMIRARVRG
jgi:alpha-ketoglutarate-dependent taurine dioxygenase